jgi:hypothetical protein
MIRLLVVKSGTDYLRFVSGGHLLCQMDKASVFPFEQLPRVKEMMHQAMDAGASPLQLCQLTIVEEPLQEDD